MGLKMVGINYTPARSSFAVSPFHLLNGIKALTAGLERPRRSEQVHHHGELMALNSSAIVSPAASLAIYQMEKSFRKEEGCSIP